MNNCTFIIFGISGDLAKRKLLPGIYRLIAEKRIDSFAIIGAAIDDTNVETILANAKPFARNVKDEIWNTLVENTHYERMDFLELDDFKKLATTVENIEKKKNLPGNRLLYLATASDHFCPITRHAATTKLIVRGRYEGPRWHRIVYEKPFGKDGESAHEINTCIAEWVDENQVYRIDHFLTKELVSNISLMRFTNLVFEPLWNKRYIDQVQIILNEQVCVENRGSYYDAYGALRDMVQNHMLELLALIAMESPAQLSGDSIPEERAKVLKKTRIVDGILGQYDGYTKEQFVDPASTTETFAALKLEVNNPRWTGVPFYLKTGKCLDRHESVIHIKFKQVDCLLARSCPSESNWLTIRLAPEASFSLSLNAKKPGHGQSLIPITMDFCHSCIFGPLTPEAYEILLDEVIRGEQSIGVRFDEIEYAWKVIDDARTLNMPLVSYKSGTAGPQEAEVFAKKHGMRWRS